MTKKKKAIMAIGICLFVLIASFGIGFAFVASIKKKMNARRQYCLTE